MTYMHNLWRTCVVPVDNLVCMLTTLLTNESLVLLDRGGEGCACVITLAGASEIHKKDHRRKDIKVTKKTLKIKDIETLEICCVNTTLM